MEGGRTTRLKRSSRETVPGAVEDCEHCISQQCDLAAENSNTSDGQISRNVVFKVWKNQPPLPLRSHWSRHSWSAVCIWVPSLKEHTEKLARGRSVTGSERVWKSCHMRNNRRNEDCFNWEKELLGQVSYLELSGELFWGRERKLISMTPKGKGAEKQFNRTKKLLNKSTVPKCKKPFCAAVTSPMLE